jgi:hypothetical protein
MPHRRNDSAAFVRGIERLERWMVKASLGGP